MKSVPLFQLFIVESIIFNLTLVLPMQCFGQTLLVDMNILTLAFEFK